MRSTGKGWACCGFRLLFINFSDAFGNKILNSLKISHRTNSSCSPYQRSSRTPLTNIVVVVKKTFSTMRKSFQFFVNSNLIDFQRKAFWELWEHLMIPICRVIKEDEDRDSTSTMAQNCSLSQYFPRFKNNKKGICLNIKLLEIVTHRNAVGPRPIASPTSGS